MCESFEVFLRGQAKELRVITIKVCFKCRENINDMYASSYISSPYLPYYESLCCFVWTQEYI